MLTAPVASLSTTSSNPPMTSSKSWPSGVLTGLKELLLSHRPAR